MRVSRIYRLLRLITLLQSGRRFTVDELADELQVSRRTVFRDLNLLEMAHIPYFFDRERNSYFLSSHFFLPPVNLDLAEALSLMLLTVRSRPGEQLWPAHARRAAMKLENAVPAPVRDHIGSVLDTMRVLPAASARHEGVDSILEQLAGAIAARRVCRIVYLSFFERKQMRLTVRPLRLVFVQRAWYLLGFSTHHREIRTFKMGRIKQLSVTDRTFSPPKPAEVDAHFGAAWSMIPEGKCHNIHLRFDAEVAGTVAEVQWHPSQEIQWRDDGSLDFRVRVDGLGEITWWILGYGDRVRVIKPARLLRNIRKMAERMVRLYESPEGGS